MRRSHVDLFSGIGGFALAARWAGVETVAFAEIDSYASRVLQRHWPDVRNYGDVRDVPAIEGVWLVTGGVPCQPASVAGKRRGADDDRWLWPEAFAAVERIRPAWVLFENPTGILSLNDGVEFERICTSLEGQGYEIQPIVIPACGVGAPHRRNRIWILGHTTGQRLHAGSFVGIYSGQEGARAWDAKSKRRGSDVANTDGAQRGANAEGRTNVQNGNNAGGEKATSRSSVRGDDVSDANIQRLSLAEHAAIFGAGRGQEGRATTERNWWAVEPNVGRVANGIPKRVDRLKCLGNAIVPQVALQLIKRMIEAEQLQ